MSCHLTGCSLTSVVLQKQILPVPCPMPLVTVACAAATTSAVRPHNARDHRQNVLDHCNDKPSEQLEETSEVVHRSTCAWDALKHIPVATAIMRLMGVVRIRTLLEILYPWANLQQNICSRPRKGKQRDYESVA